MRHLFLYISIILAAFVALMPVYGRLVVDDALSPPGYMAPDSSDREENTDAAPMILPDSVVEFADSVLSRLFPDTLSVAVSDSVKAPSVTHRPRLDSTLMHRTSVNPDSAAKPKGVRRIVREQVDLDNPVDFSSKDSMILVGTDRAYMYGDGKVVYGDIKLDAANINMNMANSTVYAEGAVDSLGEVIGQPVFTDAGTDYQSKTMTYNFKTGKGFITDVITQQGEGYLTGGLTKKIDDRTFYIQDGKYTTCDQHDDPHFWLQLTKAKVTPKSNIVSGPAYMVLAGLPLPLAVPFGYFPFSEKYSSGIIMPTFGDDYNKGFYLSNGGYYFAFSDYVDLRLMGEIYTKGSWGLNAQSRYVKRYKFSGNVALSYLNTVNGDKGMPDYSKSTNFQIIWTHSQDSKANPNMNFSASVNFTTSGYTRNDINSYYSSAFTENTKSSSISLSYKFPNSKWSINTTANISQRTQDSTLTVSFPNLTVTMQQTYPFKRKRAMGNERWYEKIKLSYTGQFSNTLTARQDEFFKKSLIKDWRNGFKHNVPISATFNLFQYFNITPAVTLNDRMYTTRVKRSWDPNASVEVMDTAYSFYNVLDFNGSVSIDTKIYGFFKPWKIFGDRVSMIRHVLTPTISLSGAPDFSDPMWGIYGNYEYMNSQGVMTQRTYSMFPNAIYGVPSQGKSGVVSVSLANNVEMKLRSKGDSIQEKKISLIENLSISQSYNFAADSLRWSNVNASVLIRLVKNFNLNLNTTWDPYTYRLNSSGNPVRVDIPRWRAGKGWVRLSSAGTSFSYTFNNDTFRRKKDASSGKKNEDENDAGDNTFDGSSSDLGLDDDTGASSSSSGSLSSSNSNMEFNDDGYMKWSCPWSLSVNYSLGYAYGDFNYEKMEYNGRFTQNLSVSGNIRPTAGWNFSMSASYNFDTHKISYMNCNITRDLHCFTMTASFVPLGPYKSYNFHIAVSSSLLADLKYDKRSSTSNGVRWY